MDVDIIEEHEMFRAIDRSSARALLIGRRALVAIGIPVLTSDYDFWAHRDDIEKLNAALEPLGLIANKSPEQARATGRYVLENGEHVDVLNARAVQSKVTAEMVTFDDVWSRRRELVYEPGIRIFVPTIDDLIKTKQWAMREKDVLDIKLLEAKRAEEQR